MQKPRAVVSWQVAEQQTAHVLDRREQGRGGGVQEREAD